MKKFKAAISVLLTVVMIFSVCYVANAETVIAETESNNDYESANTASVNSTFTGVLSDSSDEDYYKIVPDSDGKLDLVFKHSYADKDDGWLVRIYYYNNIYNEMSSAVVYMRENETVKFPSLGVTSGGVYYVSVVSDWGTDNPVGHKYTIKSTFTPTEYHEKETNEKYSDATFMELGQTYQGTINKDGDKDYYKFIPEANGKISLEFNHNYEDKDGGWYVEIFYYGNGNYNSLSQCNIYLRDNESVNLPSIGAVADGVYYIYVAQEYFADSVGYDYTIRTDFVPTENYEKETNENYSDANSIKIGETYNGTLNRTSDKDYYKFIPESNGKVSFVFKHNFVDADSGWMIKIYYYNNGSYTALSETKIYLRDNETTVIPIVGAVKDGVYFLSVETEWGGEPVGYDYTIESSFEATENYEKEVNDSYSLANSVKKNEVYAANMNSGSDVDYFKFTAQSTGEIPVTFMHTYRDFWAEWYVNIYKYESGEYSELYSTNIMLSDSVESSEIYKIEATEGVTYFIKVAVDNPSATDEYMFIVGEQPVSYNLIYDANGGSDAPAAQTGATEYIVSDVVPVRDGYIFLGWSFNSQSSGAEILAGNKLVLEKDCVVYAVWKKIELTTQPTEPTTEPTTKPTEPTTEPSTVKPTEPATQPTEPTTKPTEPTTKPTEPVTQPTTKPAEPVTEPSTKKPDVVQPGVIVKMKTPSQTSINYGDSIVLHAEVKNLPEGAELVWSANNENFKIVSTSVDGLSCTVTPQTSGDTLFTVTVIDKDGNELGNDEQRMTSKAGFFQKIIAFFKKLFGLTKIIPEAVKNIF